MTCRNKTNWTSDILNCFSYIFFGRNKNIFVSVFTKTKKKIEV